jgi:hypothetical protein
MQEHSSDDEEIGRNWRNKELDSWVSYIPTNFSVVNLYSPTI